MDTLQKLFEKTIQDSLTFPIVGAKLIKKQMEKKGIILTEKQISYIEEKLQNINGDSINLDFDLDDHQNKTLGISDGEKIEIDIGGEKEINEFFQEFIEKMEENIPEIIEEITIPLMSSLTRDMPTILKTHRKDKGDFEKRLHKDWEKPFDLFEVFIILAIEAGDEFNREFRSDEKEKENYVLEALTRLHARACQISFEILALLRNGFADGAHARWRSLHEIAVVALFINKYGNEVAEKYLLHDNIESFKAASLYMKYYKKLGDEPIPKDEYDSIESVYKSLISRFGDTYKENYGWAASTIGKRAPNFSDIEKNVKLDYLRPYYKLASHNVHANPKGIMFKLGLIGDTRNILLAGPSNYGFTDPAQFTVDSLRLVTVTLLTKKSTIDNHVMCNILFKLEAEIGKEFFKIQKKIEEEEIP